MVIDLKDRKKIISSLLNENKIINKRINILDINEELFYNEILLFNELNEVCTSKSITAEEYLKNFVFNELNEVVKDYGISINENKINIESTDFYDGYEINIPLKESNTVLDNLFTEIDNAIIKNTASGVPINKEPYSKKLPNLPTDIKDRKFQNPKRINLFLKKIIEDDFIEHEIQSDIGTWTLKDVLNKNDKVNVKWVHKQYNYITIEGLFFPMDSNKIMIKVYNKQRLLKETFFEIYNIPIGEDNTKKFLRKTVFKLLKKYIDTEVIQLDPFKDDFIFWKTNNPSFLYTFSMPDKNKIILDLINFINTAQKPILDDFFENNNLKHKQGYLQSLLDAAESAGIFIFKREGNEILILRGRNYKSFLEGKLRRIVG